ncbi:hypothetical protein HYS47_00935 [Candidatus Woesearchaeota archaeon]|nr:hypothetical protein [Candidatus Woesearchaeota archaeon]
MALSRRTFLQMAAGMTAGTLLLPVFPEGSLLDELLLPPASAQPSKNNHVQDHVQEPESQPAFHTGDIIAHTSRSTQSPFIQLATDSPYTHMGMIVERKGGLYVIEAVEPVKYTTLNAWIARGVDKRFTVKRLHQPLSGREGHTIAGVVREAEQHLGKHYDRLFKPTDKRMYCSELVAKAYERGAGIHLGEWKTVDDVIGGEKAALQTIPSIRREIQRRWGTYPGDMKVITPKSIMGSPLLDLVYSTIEAKLK